MFYLLTFSNREWLGLKSVELVPSAPGCGDAEPWRLAESKISRQGSNDEGAWSNYSETKF